MRDSERLAETGKYQGTPQAPTSAELPTSQPGPATDHSLAKIPERIGRYRIERILGKGGFGMVYLAHDEELTRLVAIKVPHPERVSYPEDAQAYLAEARTVANLDHSHIVPVYDVGSTPEFPVYVVSKYVDGGDLALALKHSRKTFLETAEFLATVAEAVHYAHKQGLFHRDLKPANILLDKAGRPFVADFGLALRERDIGKGSRYVGTPAYMSPEQARGEGHRIDGRSDVFSLGIVLYEMLAGRRPFHGQDRDELLEQISTRDVPPPRQVEDSIPKELERICLKALSKRAADRYTTARDLAEDLRAWRAKAPETELARPASNPAPAEMGGSPVTPQTTLTATPRGLDAAKLPATANPASESRPIKIVPKGLRSFDEHDADFFLELLPGPHDRDGLPDSLRFWKTRIEEPDGDKTFAVGMIYGPSGCGKSSLVKAGLLPRLAPHVIPVYLEATAEETEFRLLNGLRKRCPALPDDLGLKETLAALRRGQGAAQGKKVLIVLDQFEQWLHARRDQENTELVQALRHCDSSHVQCLVMVRDDFWMAATRFMRELEIRLLEGHNSAAVDLFPTKHARKVLAAFGRAYGTVGESATEKQAGLPRFLDQAIVELSEDAKVVCVRLALFAEMMKGKAWTPASLQQGGGAQGVGVTFLEETFSAATAPPEHRLHQKAARGILKALLPESGADIKGHMRSFGVLLDASGYAGRTKDFHDLIRILNSEIRLITPTDPEGKEQSDEAAAGHVPGERYYQLTHDYLVPSLREWLTRKQKETRKGRAELRLAERAAAWSRKSENRNLPAWWEWLNIRLLTRPHDRTTSQQQMMARADLYYTWRGIAIFTAALAVISAAWVVRRQSIEHSQATIAAEQVRRLLDAETERVPEIIEEIKDFRPWTEPLLKAADAEAVRNEPQSTSEVERARQARRHLHTSLALLPGDPAQVKYLYDRMLSAQPREVAVIAEALESRKKELIDPLWRVVDQPEPGRESQRLRAACALARYDSSSLRWNNTSAPVVSQLVEVDPASLSDWMAGLRPVRRQLVGPLTAVFHDRGPDQVAERSLATSMLADFASDQPDLLAELVMDADEKQFVALFPKVAEHVGAATSRFEVELARPVAEAFSGAERDALAARQANAGVGLLRLGRPERVWLLLKHTPDPSVRSYFIHRLASMGARPQLIVDRLHQERDVSSRIALLLILGEFTGDQLPLSDREALVPTVLQMYRDDPDPGLHGASEWLLHRWEQHPRLAEIDKRLATGQVEGNRGWYINREEQTLVIVRGGVEFFMGSPLAEQGRDFEGPDESQHQRQIDRTYAIATKEVTVEQFLRFRKEHPYNRQYAPTADCPVNHVSWYDAVAYCNWLSKMDDVPPDQWCYAPNDAGEYADGMKLAADYFRLTGYRLPTEAEWEFASRAGAITSRYYGRTEELLAEYAWYVKGPADRRLTPSGSRKPNDWGLFDVLGNAWERCQGRFEDYRIVVDERVGRVIHNGETHALRGGSIFNPSSIRSAHREMDGTTRGHNYIGFRPVRTLLKEGAKEGGSRPIQK